MEKNPTQIFNFHLVLGSTPTNEELIVHYLRNKATASSLPPAIIAEVDLYKCKPWELPSLCCCTQHFVLEIFFYSFDGQTY